LHRLRGKDTDVSGEAAEIQVYMFKRNHSLLVYITVLLLLIFFLSFVKLLGHFLYM